LRFLDRASDGSRIFRAVAMPSSETGRQGETVARGAAPDGYWRQSRGPLASLLFIAPFLVIYEVGMLMAGPQALRNGADIWLRQLLDWIGFGNYFLLPALTAAILLAWQHLSGMPWRVAPRVFFGMAAESGGLALALLFIARWHANWFAALLAASAVHAPGWWGRLTLYLGAGIYEELLFRLVLLSLLAAALRGAGLNRAWSFAVAAAISSLVFSAAHYVGPHGDALRLSSFVFRFLAGAFFAVLFVARGFGIAAGAHACYDILVGLRAW
jgi:membrane protease YdiL (CAAX protease family)